MLTNSIRPKIINLILIFIFISSCKTLKPSNNYDVVEKCLIDYIKCYKQQMPDKSLTGIVINFHNEEIILVDAPKVYVLAGINDLNDKKSNDFIIGTYQGILVKGYNKKIRVLNKVTDSTIVKANELKFATDKNGNTIEVDMNLIDWDPTFIIKYKPRESKKEVQMIGKNLETQNF